MTKFEKWIIYTVCAPIGALLWLSVGMFITVMYDRILFMMGILT